MDAELAIEKLMGFFDPVVQFLHRLGVPHDAAFLGFFILLAALWIGFALWGAEVAGQRGHSRVINFINGLAIPVIYPVILPTIIGRRQKKRWRRMKEEEARKRDRTIMLPEQRRRRPIGGTSKGAGRTDRLQRPRTGDTQLLPDVARPITDDDQHREKIAAIKEVLLQQRRGQEGTSAPARLRIAYGDYQIVSTAVLEILPQAVVVETADDSGERDSEALRIPLARITRIEREEESGVWRRIDPADGARPGSALDLPDK